MLVTTVNILKTNNGAAMRARTLIKEFNLSNVKIISFFRKGSVTKDGVNYNFINLSFYDFFIIPFLILFKNYPVSVAVFQRYKFKHLLNNNCIFHLSRATQINFISNSHILDFCESHSHNLSKRLKHYKFIFNKLLKFEISRLDKYENKILGLYYSIYFITNNDIKFKAKNYKVLPNKVKLSNFCLKFSERNKRKICFLGEMTYLPNIKALQWIDTFIDTIDYDVHVYGKYFKKPLLKNSNKFFFHGFVDDLDFHIKDSIATVFFSNESTGLQNKILDYLNYGIPVFTNQVVADSFMLNHPLKLIKNKNDFIKSLNYLTSNKQYYNNHTKLCKDYIYNNYSI